MFNPTAHEHSMKKDKTYDTDELTQVFVATQYAFAEEWTNNSIKTEEAELSKNNTVVVWLMEVKSNAVKSNIA